MSALGDALGAIAPVLDARGLRWFVFGAQVVGDRGALHTDREVDVVVEVDHRLLFGLIGALLQRGFTHCHPSIAGRLLVRGPVVPLVHRSGLEVNLVLAGTGEEVVMERARRALVAGVDVSVVPADDPAVTTLRSGRGEDPAPTPFIVPGHDHEDATYRDEVAELAELAACVERLAEPGPGAEGDVAGFLEMCRTPAVDRARPASPSSSDGASGGGEEG